MVFDDIADEDKQQVEFFQLGPEVCGAGGPVHSGPAASPRFSFGDLQWLLSGRLKSAL